MADNSHFPGAFLRSLQVHTLSSALPQQLTTLISLLSVVLFSLACCIQYIVPWHTQRPCSRQIRPGTMLNSLHREANNLSCFHFPRRPPRNGIKRFATMSSFPFERFQGSLGVRVLRRSDRASSDTMLVHQHASSCIRGPLYRAFVFPRT